MAQGMQRHFTLYLILVMVAVTAATVGLSIWALYRVAFEQVRTHLEGAVRHQAQLMETVARFGAASDGHRHPEGPHAIPLEQVIQAIGRYPLSYETEEYVVGRLEGERVVFLLSRGAERLFTREPLEIGSVLARPMQQALTGQTGARVSTDYRGVAVLAAYATVPSLKAGIVHKIDLAEVRAPFVRTALLSLLFGMPAALLGVWLFYRIARPVARHLAESEARFRAVIDVSPVPCALNDAQGNILYLNAAFVGIYGYDQSDIPTLADWWPKAYPDAEYRRRVAHDWQARLDEAERTGAPFEPLEATIRCKDGAVRTALAGSVSLGEAFAGVHLVTLYDITGRKAAEGKIRATLSEKEVLLRELHHRVKNNMQVVSSMLGLQARHLTAENALQAFADSRERIQSLAMIHERMYDSEDLGHIDLLVYVRYLAIRLVRLYQHQDRDVRAKVSGDGVVLGIDQALPCALIVHELLTNALRHACNEDGAAAGVEVVIGQAPTGECVVAIRDYGRGPGDWVTMTSSPRSLGLTIVRALAGQLRGEVAFEDARPGTRAVLRFPATPTPLSLDPLQERKGDDEKPTGAEPYEPSADTDR